MQITGFVLWAIVASCVAGSNAAVAGCPPNKLICLNSTHWIRNVLGTADECEIGQCPQPTYCDGRSCVGDIAFHLSRAADYQLVMDVTADELDKCGAWADDAAAGRILCDVWHATDFLQPSFGLSLFIDWLTFQQNNSNPCLASPAAYRQCLSQNSARQIAALQARSPTLMASGGLMEFIDKNNLDDPTQYPAVCVPGSEGAWGDNNTCIPDIKGSQYARDYYVAWGKAYIDAGVRAIFFGQARLTGGEAQPGVTSAVSEAGAEGFQYVIQQLRAYAAAQNYSTVYFGPQAACCIVANGVEQADFVYGAQHLMTAGPDYLVQPLMRKGHPFYGPNDWHDANLINDASGIPVILDYDNWSGNPSIKDDIRLLASAPLPERIAMMKNHWRNLRLYNPRATVIVVLSKFVACFDPGTCGVPMAPEDMFLNIGPSGVYSSMNCGTANISRELLLEAFPDPTAVNGSQTQPIDRVWWGQQLRVPDVLVTWAYLAILNRNADLGGYEYAVQMLPSSVDSASGARCDFVMTLVESAEYQKMCAASTNCAAVTVTALSRSILLWTPDAASLDYYVSLLASGMLTPAKLAAMFCAAADQEALYTPLSA
eukprot:TRINITY_DN18544_c0_g1_i1.p1 TRINITY_DN18544_c0_g1~~TRINITY_DN18544_c0_g1_i1.p1  ORF type:complete len:599 (-),score=174.79 TRINITY_DN18544_c0_g1_i1:51-1847(-)